MLILDDTFLLTPHIKVSVKCFAEDISEAEEIVEKKDTAIFKLKFNYNELPFVNTLRNLADYIFDCMPNCISVKVISTNDESSVTCFDKVELEKKGLTYTI